MVFSGLVDDNPKSDPDYLLRIAAEPDPDVEAGPPPPALPAWALGDGHQAEQIVVRRIGVDGDQHAEVPSPPPVAPPPALPLPRAAAPVAPPPRAAAPVPPPPRAAAPVPPPPPTAPQRAFAGPLPPQREVSVHRVAPKSFNDAQQVADRFKASTPVVLDMEGVDGDLAKRLIGFASGLTYGLDGGMERLGGRVFLLIPPGVEIPDAQRTRLAAQGSLVG